MFSRWFLASLALLFLAVGGTAYVDLQREALFPERIPTHWGIDGKPDAYTAREQIGFHLWLMVAMVAGMLALGRVLPWLSPATFGIEPFRPTYEYIFFLITLLFVYLHTILILAQMGALDDLGRWLMAGLFVLFAGMGNVMGKVRKNFFVGIRTPWTLASDTVWEATHRLAAWLFVGGGGVGLLLLLTPLNPMWLIALVLVLALVPVGYSLWLYKRLEAQGRLEPLHAEQPPVET
jgi:uncharacterized membrane protein